ncbi:MAG TPA: hypothetical protein VH482_29205 [Thermomicrobiales bacterium]
MSTTTEGKSSFVVTSRSVSQVPTSGCPAMLVGMASWASAERGVAARATPSPPAPSPAIAVRRETAGPVVDVAI